jgi:ABC-2 type transport system ATP-binding protein
MTEPQITVHNLTKTYRVPQREAGMRAALRSLVHPSFHTVEAVRKINFSIAAGEVVGFIGPNGAGKTTSLKLLSGLLYPSSGEANVAGFIPWERKPDFLRRISMVLGNKSQMIWDIPPLDTFRVLAEIYSIQPVSFHQILDEMVALLDMEELLTRPVRNLSLGERMKCELVAGLLHHPIVLFLDEPTLGLDVSMQKRLRSFIAEYNRLHGATIILTSHYMADVAALCPRIILIHDGQIQYDGALAGLAERLAPYKLIKVTLDQAIPPSFAAIPLPGGAELLESENGCLTLRVSRLDTPSVTTYLLNNLAVIDLSVEDPPLEAVIDKVYQEGL